MKINIKNAKNYMMPNASILLGRRCICSDTYEELCNYKSSFKDWDPNIHYIIDYTGGFFAETKGLSKNVFAWACPIEPDTLTERNCCENACCNGCISDKCVIFGEHANCCKYRIKLKAQKEIYSEKKINESNEKTDPILFSEFKQLVFDNIPVEKINRISDKYHLNDCIESCVDCISLDSNNKIIKEFYKKYINNWLNEN